MAVLSIDLASRRWADLGIVILEQPAHAPTATRGIFAGLGPLRMPLPHQATFAPTLAPATVNCEIVQWIDDGERRGPVAPEVLAGRLSHLCGVRDIRLILLDGPQAWKSRYNGLAHARVGERQLNTAAKTGLPGMAKPTGWRPYAEFCLDVYDALCRRGWQRLETRQAPGEGPERLLVESSPQSAWRSLGLKPLPSRRRTHISDLAAACAALRTLQPISFSRPPNRGQLQAIVGGLAGLALEAHDPAGARIVGAPPRREEGHWREGFIVLPVPPRHTATLRWLQ